MSWRGEARLGLVITLTYKEGGPADCLVPPGVNLCLSEPEERTSQGLDQAGTGLVLASLSLSQTSGSRGEAGGNRREEYKRKQNRKHGDWRVLLVSPALAQAQLPSYLSQQAVTYIMQAWQATSAGLRIHNCWLSHVMSCDVR